VKGFTEAKHTNALGPGPVHVHTCTSVFITAVPIIKLFAWGQGDSGGHVLRETTSRGLCGLVCPSHTSERGGDIEVDPHRRCFGCRESDFAFQGLVECRVFETERVRLVVLRWQCLSSAKLRSTDSVNPLTVLCREYAPAFVDR
jgi:hypothetical protein